MPHFLYVAIDSSGKRVSNVEEAFGQEELVSRLQSQGMTVVKVTSYSIISPSRKYKHRFAHHGVKAEDLVLFARQLATMLGAGVSLLKSLEVILRQIASSSFYVIVAGVKRDIESGHTFRDALAKHPRIFSELWLNLVETGEASGNLPTVLDRLAHYLEMSAAFKRKIISALIYPVILVVVAFGAITFFLLKIVPTFVDLFASFDAPLPLLTRLMIQFSEMLRHGFIYIFMSGVVLWWFFKQYTRTAKGKRNYDKFLFKLPVFGEFFQFMVVERFTSEMSTLVESGVPLLYALEVSERSIGNTVMQSIIHDIKESVRAGRSLSEPMDKSNFFAPMVVQMVAIGEEIGELPKMFKRVAAFYEDYLETFVTRFTTIFEPVMLVFMGVVIGTLVISIFLPIFSIATLPTGGGAGGP